MARKKKDGHGGGGHGWFVTFADLMGLLVAFFVMLVAFSNQDQKKLQIVAGSMREAFGTQTAIRYSGIIEVDGLPTRPRLKNAAKIKPEDASATPSPDEKSRNSSFGARLDDDGAFALASASLRQAHAGHAGDRRAFQAGDDRGDQAGPQHRDRSTRTAARCFRRAPRSRTSAPAGWCSGWPAR